MRRAALLGLFLAACKPVPAPGPELPTAESIYLELVEAGCMAPAPDGVDAVAQESVKVPPPAWLSCMQRGGSVGDCETPCR